MLLNKLFTWFETRIDPYPQDAGKISTNSFTSFAWHSMDGIKRWFLYFAFIEMLLGVFEASLFWMMGKLVDTLAAEHPSTFWHNQHTLLIFFIILIVSSIVFKFLDGLLHLQTIVGPFSMRLRWWFHHVMMKQSMRFFQDEFAGRITAKIMQTALAVREVILSITQIGVYLAVYFITSAFILSSFDRRFLVPYLLWFILMGFLMYFMVPRIGRVTQLQADARSLMTGRVTDTYANIQTVKLHAQQEAESAYAREAMDDFLVSVHRQMRLVTLLNLSMHLINMGLILSLGILGVWLWSRSIVTVGGISASVAIALKLNNMATWVMWAVAALFENVGIVRDGMNTFSLPPEIVDSPDAKKLVVTQGEIIYQGVDFSYTPDSSLLENFNLTIHAGEKIGLVGYSGSGKSTVINLLLRFYELKAGSIQIDGQKVNEVTQESLRRSIGMVTQDTSLLHRSIRENILYGMPAATEEQIIEAAKQAKAHEFILQLSDKYGNTGYDTLVGERGVKLSGGQRQRILIARIMLRKTPILILDEATSALDSEVEADIKTALYRLMENKTVIAIAHRLSTIAEMDRLVVMKEGEIAEMGTHQELLKLKGIYARLWERQRGDFLGVD
ncbi:MAG: ABC transporter ATP-binding protein [Neisseriaceae bacterium]